MSFAFERYFDFSSFKKFLFLYVRGDFLIMQFDWLKNI